MSLSAERCCSAVQLESAAEARSDMKQASSDLRTVTIPVADPLCQRESSTSSPLIAQRSPTGSAASNSPATHRWSAGSHLTPLR